MTAERDRTPEERRRALLDAYPKIRSDIPPWARPDDPQKALVAPIPFIGNRYGDGPRILVYASAENLNTAATAPWAGNPELALDRHRYAWDNGWSPPPNGRRTRRPPPADAPRRHCIGIAPFEDGPLRAAAGLLWRWEHEARRTTTEPPIDPDVLTERLAVANFSKFAFPPSGPNRDVKNVGHLSDSVHYLAADIKHLDPEIILVAKTISSPTLQRAFIAAAGGRQIIWMPQAAGQSLTDPARRRASLEGASADDLTIDVPSAWCAMQGRGWQTWRQLLRRHYLAARAQVA